MSRFVSSLVLVSVFVASSPAQNACGTGSAYFATSVANYTPGPGVTAGTGFGITSRILCVPGGTTDVLTLGVQGSVTVAFDFPITNGPGTDFVAWENGFVSGGIVFGELAFVEVSTNGVDFARFPNQYFGPPGPIGAFSGLPAGSVKNIAGLGLRTVPPALDGYAHPALAGGDPFDLDDLVADPLVTAGTVDLANINYVRLVDVLGNGSSFDSFGTPVYDPTGGTNSSDWDAVAVVNNTVNQDVNRPTITVSFDPATRQLTLAASDVSGWMTISGTTHFTINGVPNDLGSVVAAFFPFITMTTTSVSVTSVPIPVGMFGRVCLSAADDTGLVGVDCDSVTP
jgi:hypothetical protein